MFCLNAAVDRKQRVQGCLGPKLHGDVFVSGNKINTTKF